MGNDASKPPTARDATTWFSVFRAAAKSGDRDLQAIARRELEALGYRVAVRRPAHQQLAKELQAGGEGTP